MTEPTTPRSGALLPKPFLRFDGDQNGSQAPLTGASRDKEDSIHSEGSVEAKQSGLFSKAVTWVKTSKVGTWVGEHKVLSALIVAVTLIGLGVFFGPALAGLIGVTGTLAAAVGLGMIVATVLATPVVGIALIALGALVKTVVEKVWEGLQYVGGKALIAGKFVVGLVGTLGCLAGFAIEKTAKAIGLFILLPFALVVTIGDLVNGERFHTIGRWKDMVMDKKTGNLSANSKWEEAILRASTSCFNFALGRLTPAPTFATLQEEASEEAANAPAPAAGGAGGAVAAVAATQS